jgi:hypothetical protein
MDSRHLRHLLQDLIDRRHFVRTLRPDSDRYKLWLGDLVEVVNDAYGPDSAELRELRGLLAGRPRPDRGAAEAARERDYLARVDALGEYLDRLRRAVRDPIIFVEPDGGRG